MITTSAHLHSIEKSPSGDVAFVLFQVAETFAFSEGQFIMIECNTPTDTQKRPYSIATTNKQLQEEKLIGFYVKQVSEAGVSHYLTQIIKPGDQVLFKGPVGHYTLSDHVNNILLISTGSGLSPNLGILEALLHSSKQATIVSLFGERAREKMVDSCTRLLTTQDDRLTSLITYSKEGPVADYERSGYVQEHLDECLEIFKDISDLSVFICGRPDMVKEVEQSLLEEGIEKKYITTEKY